MAERQLSHTQGYADAFDFVNTDPAAMAAYFPMGEGDEAWDQSASFLDLANEGPIQGTIDSLLKMPQISVGGGKQEFKYIPSQHAISAYDAATTKFNQPNRQVSGANTPEGYHSFEYHRQTHQANLAVTLTNAFSSMLPSVGSARSDFGSVQLMPVTASGTNTPSTPAEFDSAEILASFLNHGGFGTPRHLQAGAAAAAGGMRLAPNGLTAEENEFFQMQLPEVTISSFPSMAGNGKRRSNEGPGVPRDDKKKRNRIKSPEHQQETMEGAQAQVDGFASAGASLLGSSCVCALYLETLDENQCRFSVKNDDKESNQKLAFVQSNGYVEYKARYCRKRGQKSGYGFFHLGFVEAERSIYPLLRVEGDEKKAGAAAGGSGSGYAAGATSTSSAANGTAPSMLHMEEVNPAEINRMEITVRMYQSFRGDFPTRLIKFDDDETYHALYVKEWQDATMLRVSETDPAISYLNVEQDPNGEYLRYIVQDTRAIEMFRSEGGVRFPCPIPAHPERLNDVGMLRLQVSLRIFTKHGACEGYASPFRGFEYNTWIRFKVVQQLSGKKRKFSDMLRPADPSEIDLPPRPEILPITMSHDMVIDHVLGSSVFTSQQGYKLVQNFAARVSDTEARAKPADSSDPPSILQMACRKGNAAVILLLLQHNVSLVHSRDKYGNTPLHIAAQMGMANVIHVLLEVGANPALRNNNNENCVNVASGKIKEMLQRQIDMDCNATGTSLFRAVCMGSVSSLKKNLLSPEDMNKMDLRGMTPMQIAVKYNHPMCVQALIHAGADTSVTDEEGNTFLHLAADAGAVEILTILLHHKKSLANVRANDGCTPIFRAAAGGHSLCTMILSECGSDVNLRNASGETPLDVALSGKFPCTALVLIKYGAKATSGEVNPHILFDFPRTGGTMHEASLNGDVALARHLVASGVSPTILDEAGMTPVVIAIKNGHALLLDELLVWASHLNTLDGDVNGPNAEGRTPLHIACERVDIGCVVILLSNKIADVDCLDSQGDTPLHVAAEKGLSLTAAFLRLAGAKTSIRNKAGETPADKAAKLGHKATLQVLQATKEILVPISKVLEQKPHFDDSSDDFFENDQFFSWDQIGKILNTIWHCMHQLRSIIGQYRSVPRAERV